MIAAPGNAKKTSPIYKYQSILSQEPFNQVILFMLATEYLKSNFTEEAIVEYKKILNRNPQNTKALFNLGVAYIKWNNDVETAYDCFQKVLEISPTHTKAMAQIAHILEKQKKLSKAITTYKKIIQITPNNANAYKIVGTLLKKQELCQEAIPYLTKASELAPQDRMLLFTLGNTYLMMGEAEKAIQEFKKILAYDPRSYVAKHNIGYALKSAGLVNEAIKYYKEATEINPAYEASIYAMALAHLYKGDFKEGWKQYEWRLKKEKRNAEKLRQWIKKNNVRGKKIYLLPEGGIGDTIQFFRYVEVLQQMGADLIISVQKPLIPLLSNCPYIDRKLLCSKRDHVPLSYQDMASIMSLPAIFESEEKDIPINIPYIFPDKKLIEKWCHYFENNKNFKIGICWEADVKNDVSRLPVARRSIPLAKLQRLAALPHVQFYSLQKSSGASQVENLPQHFVVQTFGPNFDGKSGPFMDTAAIMTQLDLILTVDTSIAHLAGALGRPVWVMLPLNTDWRWIVNRKTSPWYPTMKVFKQEKPFDWDGVVMNIFEELENILNE